MLKAAAFTTVSVLLVAMPLLSHTAAPQAASHSAAPDPAKVQAGQTLFQNNCLPCHSLNEGQTGLGPSLYHELAKTHPKKTPAEVHTILKDGKGKMPAFGDRLTPENMDDLIAYLHTV